MWEAFGIIIVNPNLPGEEIMPPVFFYASAHRRWLPEALCFRVVRPYVRPYVRPSVRPTFVLAITLEPFDGQLWYLAHVCIWEGR